MTHEQQNSHQGWTENVQGQPQQQAAREALSALSVLVSNLHPHLSTADATKIREGFERVSAAINRASEVAP